jgi:HK97 family phage major capsid protein
VANVGEIVGEGQQVSTQDVSVGHIMFGAFKFSTKMVKVSLELMQDSAFDMENFLADNFGQRLGRILNTKFTLGVGTTEPLGIITAATAGPTAVGSSTNTGGSETGGTSIGTTDLVELEHSVDPAYRRGARYMMHDLTLKKIKELLDKYGHPIWLPGIAAGAPDTILGYPYSINNDMATIAVNAKTVAFGRLDKYLIRRVKDLAVLRLVERFADYGQVAFIGFARYDGNLLDAGTRPVKYLAQAAT